MNIGLVLKSSLAVTAATVAMAFTVSSSKALADDLHEAIETNTVAPTEASDDIYADFSTTLDAQLRPGDGRGPGRGGPGGPGHGGPGHGGPGRGGPPGHGGGGWGGGPGRGGPPPRMVTCWAYNLREQAFRGEGRDTRSAMWEAKNRCERFSRRCSVSPRDCR